MKVAQSFRSHREIWDALPSRRNIKSAKVNPLGDIYEPKQDINDEFDYLDYYEPVDSHVHANQWQADIDYKTSYGKRPALLVGDAKYSFIWSHPIIYFKHMHSRTKIWHMKDFTKSLCSHKTRTDAR